MTPHISVEPLTRDDWETVRRVFAEESRPAPPRSKPRCRTGSSGIELRLLRALVAESEKKLVWTLQSGIVAVNTASIELHKRAGFRIVGVRERLGQLRGQWHDMERRSPIVYPIPHA
jgi:hypothetical protein